MSTLPREEYPRPQFVRPDWLCLNGAWQFEIDPGDSGLERGMLHRPLSGQINVPFCPESILSGIGHVDFIRAAWYRREVQIPREWSGRRVLLHFQACDYDTTVWVNGREAARHRGGFTPISMDLHGVVEPGASATIVVRARDDMRQPKPRGKQSAQFANHGCEYTRTTGIWQTVWMEPVPHAYLKRARITPNVPGRSILVEQPIVATNTSEMSVRAALRDGDEIICRSTAAAGFGFAARLDLAIPEGHLKLWGPGNPHLYGLDIELLDSTGKTIDRVESYAGLRALSIDGKAVKLNGQTLFQRLVLDQGFYPDGILTAPSDEALRRDIELSMQAGFNGARLHQKVFEERFLYHADQLGYLVWGEFADWGMRDGRDDSHFNQPYAAVIAQWLEVLERDYSHPSIVGWCPLNESGELIVDRHTALFDLTRGLFLATKLADSTRPVIDASGYSHYVDGPDVYDCHNYEQDPAKFREQLGGLAKGTPSINEINGKPISLPYRGQPYFVSEFGGTWWREDVKAEDAGWGYGQRPRSREEALARIESLMRVLLEDPNMFGYCYTQLTDVFQEQNGIFTFDRKPKFDLERLRKLQQSPAAIERL